MSDVFSLAAPFRDRLEHLKRTHGPPGFRWYAYDSFSVFPVLDRMLTAERRDLVALAGPAPILDLGCADGGLSFFFESLGCPVVAMDNWAADYDRAPGFNSLRAALNSSVEFHRCDFDAGLDLRGRTFGLALFLGVLYHLKNPYGALETLARHARYCLLSTRVAQRTMGGTAIADDPVAYLLHPREANADASNFWIFSEAGLRRLIERTGWDVCDYLATGCRSGANPADGDRDRRAFCLLRSKLADPWLDCDLDGGWHEMEDASWRWTERVFSVRLNRDGLREPVLRFCFNLPAPARLQASFDGGKLPSILYAAAGTHTYEQPLPPGGPIRITFELDRAMPSSPADRRELGVQVVFWNYDGPEPRLLRPIAITDRGVSEPRA